ncbi:MAG: Fur family transcriptional regulator [Desulfobacterales bacterium]|jgi:Fur family peroxide stress response transcriptional regulator
MHSLSIDQRVALFTDTCRQHQLKITPQRVAIYRALIQSDQHPTADLMFRTVKKEFPNISFDTVNRTLSTFAAIGVVDVVEVFGGPKRFDPVTDGHHHLHCMACGQIIDFENERYSHLEVPDSIADTFKVISKRVVLQGFCNTCPSGPEVHPRGTNRAAGQPICQTQPKTNRPRRKR